jgi:hypothetical protein
VEITNETKASFGKTKQRKFRESVAEVLGVSAHNVTIVAVTETTLSLRRRLALRRILSAGTLLVITCMVLVPSGETGRIVEILAEESSFLKELSQALEKRGIIIPPERMHSTGGKVLGKTEIMALIMGLMYFTCGSWLCCWSTWKCGYCRQFDEYTGVPFFTSYMLPCLGWCWRIFVVQGLMGCTYHICGCPDFGDAPQSRSAPGGGATSSVTPIPDGPGANKRVL